MTGSAFDPPMPDSPKIPDAVARPLVSGAAPSGTERLVAFACIAFLFLAVFGPVLLGHFYVIEDHLLLAGRDWSASNWIDRVVGDVAAFQRFRPGYWLYHAVGVHLFGASPHLWHAATVAWGVMTCWLLYDTLRHLGADAVSTGLFVLLVATGGSQSWIWLNLIPQETIGMLWAAVAVWAAVRAARSGAPRRWDALALDAMAVAGLIKESFVLLIPALLLLRVAAEPSLGAAHWHDILRKLRGPIVAAAIVFAIELAVAATVLLSKSDGYSAGASGLSAGSFNPARWLANLAQLDLTYPLLLAAAIGAGLWWLNGHNRARLLAFLGVAAAWIVPQLVLYGPGLVERYRFPAIVGVAAVIAGATAASWRVRTLAPLGLLAAALVVPVLADGVEWTTRTVSWLRAETVAMHRTLAFVAQNVPGDKVVLMAGDSGTGYGFEATHSLPIYLREAGSASRFYLWPLVSTGQRSALHLAASRDNTAFRFPDTLAPRDVGAILIVDRAAAPLDFLPLVRWLGKSAWREYQFVEPFHAFSPATLGYSLAGEARHRVLVPGEQSAVPAGLPLLRVDDALAGLVHASPFLGVPSWGLERDTSGSGSIVWIGHGTAEGLGVVLVAERNASVRLRAEVVPGPGRKDAIRNVELEVRSASGLATQRQAFDGGRWDFEIELVAGANELRLTVLDPPTVAMQPNGDTRALLALVRGLAIERAR